MLCCRPLTISLEHAGAAETIESIQHSQAIQEPADATLQFAHKSAHHEKRSQVSNMLGMKHMVMKSTCTELESI